MKKKSPKEQPQVDWIAALNLLNKYLPDDFPPFESSGGTDRVQHEIDMVFHTDESGHMMMSPLKSSTGEVTNKYIILKTFAKDFSGNPRKSFWFANLPFKFIVSDFVKKYAKRLTNPQMRKILKAFNIGKNTRDSSIRDNSDKFFLGEADQFIEFFKGFVILEENKSRAKFSFSEVSKASGLSPKELEELSEDHKITNAGFLFSPRQKLIIFDSRI